EFLEFLGIGTHEQVLHIVLEEVPRLVTLGNLADPQVSMVDRAGNDYLRQAGRACTGQSRAACRIHAIDDKIGQFVRRDVDDACQFARYSQPLERLATNTWGVELDNLVAEVVKAFAHTIDAAGGAAKR